MKTLVIFDTAFGNTERIANAIANSLGTKPRLVHTLDQESLIGIDLLVVGSPTQGGKPTLALQDFLRRIPMGRLNDVAVAAFDTRFAKKDHGFALQMLMGTIGFAAPRIARILKSKGGYLVVEPEGFIVTDKEGPLKKGEIIRARAWAKYLSPHLAQSSW